MKLVRSRANMTAMRSVVALCCLLLAWTGVAAAQSRPPSPEGFWVTDDRGGLVQIYPCGTSGLLCGALVGFPFDHPTDHMPTTWDHRSECRFPFILNLKARRRAWGGAILDPDSGHTYSAKVNLKTHDVLRLRGYFLIPALGQTRFWSRYEGPPPPADCRMGPDALK
jgi:uncharacterized protein (DUF2147 family)